MRESSRLLFWASDLLHRLYHLPEIGQGYIDHYAEGYEGIIEAAAANATNSTRDSDGLQYFALEAYAYDIILPGQGCPGPSVLPDSQIIDTASASTAASASTTSSASATTRINSATIDTDSSATSTSSAPSQSSTDADQVRSHVREHVKY